MRRIFFHGALGEKYGKHFDMDVASVAEAVRAFAVQIPGFQQDLVQWHYRVIRRDGRHNMAMGMEDLTFRLGKAKELHFVPILRGAKDRGVGKIILGVVLAGAALTFAPGAKAGGFLGKNLGAKIPAFAGAGITYGAVGLLGGALILGGISQALAPTPNVDDYGARGVEQRPSFLFNGPVNVSAQGVAVPLVYGRMRVGSVVVSSGLSTEETV